MLLKKRIKEDEEELQISSSAQVPTPPPTPRADTPLKPNEEYVVKIIDFGFTKQTQTMLHSFVGYVLRSIFYDKHL